MAAVLAATQPLSTQRNRTIDFLGTLLKIDQID
jgi:hypothetical protein